MIKNRILGKFFLAIFHPQILSAQETYLIDISEVLTSVSKAWLLGAIFPGAFFDPEEAEIMKKFSFWKFYYVTGKCSLQIYL